MRDDKTLRFLKCGTQTDATRHWPLFRRPDVSQMDVARYLSRDAPSSRADISASYRVDAPEGGRLEFGFTRRPEEMKYTTNTFGPFVEPVQFFLFSLVCCCRFVPFVQDHLRKVRVSEGRITLVPQNEILQSS